MNSSLPNDFHLPQRLKRLPDLAYNLWWTWNPPAESVFKLIDKITWEAVNHNPVRFLLQVERSHIDAAARDTDYVNHYDKIVQSFDTYMDNAGESWFASEYPHLLGHPVAYFSTEFGLHESLPIYAGGLGILSGDFLKESSDLGLPIVAIGFLYTQGYFKQRITEDGWQESLYYNLSFPDLPVIPMLDQDGAPTVVTVTLAGREVHARLWRIQVGRVPLFLLDSNVEPNQPEDRQLTARLYSSDLESRISQEIILGIGGVRALRTLGYNPTLWHMNEGHSAFLVMELARELVSSGKSFERAAEEVRSRTAFTTHTPVPAGQDEFPLWLIDKYFTGFQEQLGIDRERFIDLGRHQQDWGEVFSMPILAIRMTSRQNGVSKLHGHTARKMWAFLWPDREIESIPIQHITNGIHTGTWLAPQMKRLYDRHLRPDWAKHVDDPETWQAVDLIPDHELWNVHRRLKHRLVAYTRERARLQWKSGSQHPIQGIASGLLLNPNALTIGFARRFATYKRADLLLRDVERLHRLVNQPGMPVQIIFAGKAHPADEPAKRMIQEVYYCVKNAENAGRLVFLEDYDMRLARYLLHGVDVWLNTPRRPLEASGTSGQKAALNGVLNLSILDGWWDEGYNGRNGWAIGEENTLEDMEAQDASDAEALYGLLEQEVVPLYYLDRSSKGMPVQWVRTMKESIRSIVPYFSMQRMVKEYFFSMYLPAMPDLD